MKNTLLFLWLLLISIIYIPTFTYAQNPEQSIIDAGSITSWVSSSGFHNWMINNSFNGSYPNGVPVGAIFSEGINWGGLVHDGGSQLVRVNGNNYQSGCAPVSRLYRVRTDYINADLINDAANFFMVDPGEVTPEEIEILRAQYETDWNEWPANMGAPYYDVNGDGIYDPSVDIPGVPGALQTIWINYNDDQTPVYGSDRIGLNIIETYWSYGLSDSLGSVIYKKVDIVYSGTASTPPDSRIDSMYICQWTDTDLGNSTDDFSGTDTVLNLGYTYNSSDYDEEYSVYNLVPPAAGNAFLQGVSEYTGSASDSAIFNFRWRKGYKYSNPKPLTVAIIHRTGGTWSDPEYSYTGALQFYNLMGGYKPEPPYPDQTTNFQFMGYGTYMLSGDPVAGTGDIDGVNDGPGDRRYWLMNGPFRMNLGDTAQVVIALAAGMGEDHLSSITALKQNTATAIEYFNNFVEAMTNGSFQTGIGTNGTTPTGYALYQNYPNPFNSFTTFTYELPERAFVKLTIYDILGREVTSLVNEQRPAGKYTVQFDAGNLSSGVYFYQMTFKNESSNTTSSFLHKTKKFILLK